MTWLVEIIVDFNPRRRGKKKERFPEEMATDRKVSCFVFTNLTDERSKARGRKTDRAFYLKRSFLESDLIYPFA